MPLCDAPALARIHAEIADRLAADHNPAIPLALVGIRTQGVPIAERLAALLREKHGITALVGAVDITLYRDDLDRARRWPVLRGTEIDFPIDDAEVILVDDVLHTGRSARAAINAICDLGRPACIRCAVLVDRGGRELPIQADYVGLHCTDIPADDRIVVYLQPVDPEDEIRRVAGPDKSQTN